LKAAFATTFPEFGLQISRLLYRTGASWGIPPTNPSRNYDMTTETGTEKWLNEGKGIRVKDPDNGGKDLFPHFKEIQGTGFKTLVENQRVEFEVTQSQKGPQASRIRAI
jgi:CspA family cold shock protein